MSFCNKNQINYNTTTMNSKSKELKKALFGIGKLKPLVFFSTVSFLFGLNPVLPPQQTVGSTTLNMSPRVTKQGHKLVYLTCWQQLGAVTQQGMEFCTPFLVMYCRDLWIAKLHQASAKFPPPPQQKSPKVLTYRIHLPLFKTIVLDQEEHHRKQNNSMGYNEMIVTECERFTEM